MPSLRLALRFARRELRGGFAGFRIFFLCLVLGSAAISGVESLSDAFLTGRRLALPVPSSKLKRDSHAGTAQFVRHGAIDQGA